MPYLDPRLLCSPGNLPCHWIVCAHITSGLLDSEALGYVGYLHRVVILCPTIGRRGTQGNAGLREDLLGDVIPLSLLQSSLGHQTK